MYCCLSRALSLAWSMLNDTPEADSAAAYSLIGIETSPKEMVPDAIGLALIGLGTDQANVRRANHHAAREIPGRALRRHHPGALRPRRGKSPASLRRSETCGHPPPLGLPAGVGRGPEILGCPAGSL